jgi:hypothetical protein
LPLTTLASWRAKLPASTLAATPLEDDRASGKQAGDIGPRRAAALRRLQSLS